MTLVGDAVSKYPASRRDPTRSGGIRRHGRAVVNRRIFELNKGLRQTLQEHDVVGLKQSVDQPQFAAWTENNAQKLGRAEPMLQRLLDITISSPSDWLNETIQVAVESGVSQALRELRNPEIEPNASATASFHAAKAANEVAGIGWETKRRIIRHVGNALETKQSPVEMMRDIRLSLEKITRRRLLLLVNTAVVAALNAGKLLTYGSNGITRVGVEPEWLPRSNSVRHSVVASDHRHSHVGIWRDEELVNVLTAGDDDVCEDCESIAEDGPYALDEAAGLIPAHPNCRCAFVPFGDRRYAEIEEQRREREDDD